MLDRISIIAVIVLLAVPSLTLSQSVEILKNTMVDWAAPNVTAGELLGVSPDNTIRPGSVRELVVQLINNATAGGGQVPGFAVECNPWYFINQDSSISEPGIFDRLSVSIAWKPNNDANLFGVGFKWTVYDEATSTALDALKNQLSQITRAMWNEHTALGPVRKLWSDLVKKVRNENSEYGRQIDAIEDEMLRKLTKVSVVNSNISELNSVARNLLDTVYSNLGAEQEYPDSVKGKLETALVSALAKKASIVLPNDVSQMIRDAQESYRKSNWASTALAVGIGATFRADTVNQLQRSIFNAETGKAYLSFTYGNGDWLMLTTMISAQTSTDYGSAYRPNSQVQGSMQLMAGSVSYHGILSAGFQSLEYSKSAINGDLLGKKGNEWRVAVGAELQVSNSMWLYFSAGKERSLSYSDDVWSADYGVRYAPSIIFD